MEEKEKRTSKEEGSGYGLTADNDSCRLADSDSSEPTDSNSCEPADSNLSLIHISEPTRP